MRKDKYKSYIKLIIWIITLMLVGSVIGGLTKSSVDTWYQTLSRSPLTPPDYVFGIAWSILYAMIAVSGWLIWEAKSCSNIKLIKRLYVSQLILNWMWTPLFFSYHLTELALICLTMIITLVSILIVKAYQNLSSASLLLIPYLLWLLFASHLNFHIWQYN